MWEAADSSALTSDRTYNPQTDTETRRDTPVTTLRWAKSPGLTNSSRTIDSSYDSGTPLHSSPLPSQAAEQVVAKVWEWKMGPRRGRLDLRARVKTEAELPTRCTRPSCRICLALAACLSLRSSSSQRLFARLLTAGMGWNDTAPRKKKERKKKAFHCLLAFKPALLDGQILNVTLSLFQVYFTNFAAGRWCLSVFKRWIAQEEKGANSSSGGRNKPAIFRSGATPR